MTTSISGTAAPVPVVSALQFYGAPARQIKSDAKSAAEQHREKLRQAKRAVESKAVEYADIMLDQHIAAALDPATDPKLARQLRMDIIELSRAREADPDDAKQRDTAAQKMLDALASFSTRAMAIEAEGKTAPRLEKDVTPGGHLDIDLSEFDAGGDDNGH